MIKFWMNAVCSVFHICLHLRVLYMDAKPILHKDEKDVSWTMIYILVFWFIMGCIDEVSILEAKHILTQ